MDTEICARFTTEKEAVEFAQSLSAVRRITLNVTESPDENKPRFVVDSAALVRSWERAVGSWTNGKKD
jgi:hypothetical protein